MKRALRLLTGLALGCDAASRAAEAPLIVPADSVHMVGTSDQLAYVTDLHPGGDGTVWVLNAREPYVLRFGADGAVLGTAGRRGQGPGEFQRPMGIVAGPAPDAVWVYEESRTAFVRVTGPEPAWREIALPRTPEPPMRLVTFDNLGMGIGRIWLVGREDGIVLARAGVGETGERRLWTSGILSLDTDNGSLTEMLRLADLLGDPGSRYGQAFYLAPYPIWAMCPDGSLLLYNPLQNDVRHVVDGHATLLAALPPERKLEVTVDRVFTILYQQVLHDVPASQRPDSAEMHASMRADFSAARHEMSTVFPEYADLQCAASGEIWIQPFEQANGYMGKGVNWLRIQADGSTRQVQLPATFRPYKFLRGRIWGVMRDELGVPSIAWISEPALN